MLCFKARTLQERDTSNSFAFAGGDGESLLLTGFMNDLYQSLQLIIKSLANYSIAFEALQGMRGISSCPQLIYLFEHLLTFSADEISQVVGRTFS